MKPICVPCKRFFRPKKTGFHFIEGMPKGEGRKVPAGNAEPDSWRPYKHWVGDLWECPDCGSTIIVGVGMEPIGEHYKPEFDERVKVYGAGQLQVNDC